MRSLIVLAGILTTWAQPGAGQQNSHAQVERGRYITATANCQSCHTEAGGEPFAGGRAMETPFGTIHTPNITFDERTGIGRWSKDDFHRALHHGRSRDGSRLYPAFPYPHFTKMPRADVDAVYDYLASRPRVSKERKEHELPFPLRWRRMVGIWNMMFFEPGEFRPDPARSPEWNRGAYLVEGPGHCAGCHTEKNLAGGDNKDRHLMGGQLENWAAPNIRGGRNGGLEDWSAADIVTFLKTGRNAHTGALTRMGEVVNVSTEEMTEADLGAIATYLKSLDSEARAASSRPSEAVLRAGRAIYFDNCSACHVSTGVGVPHVFARLAGSNKLNDPDPTTVIRIILEGARAVPTAARPSPLSMPAFGWKLSDEQVASVASYVRASWGNNGAPVTAGQVEDVRSALTARR